MNVDREKLMAMALIHDIAEAVTGDITPHDGEQWERKQVLEKQAIQTLASGESNAEVLDLWNEMHDKETPEAKLIHEIDKLEAVMQALQYETMHDVRLGEFWESADAAIRTPEIRDIFEELAKQRDRQ